MFSKSKLALTGITLFFGGTLSVLPSPVQAACVSTSLGNSACGFDGIEFTYSPDINKLSFYNFKNNTGRTPYDLHIEYYDAPSTYMINKDYPKGLYESDLSNLKVQVPGSSSYQSIEIKNAWWTGIDHNKLTSSSVPEPLTILASATALAMGVNLKKRYSKKVKKQPA
ncbi:PEP-CTERM sorting domain-containing protein [Calothrix sp. NIES-2098]|uniref:PEP-CTERM sorting domain-containing protein n=1 Tax=Calothrix sp. NIES-2098 TaxID=1954171 RepID=UPI000B61C69C|nr:hypothetical protein NIES2098_13070 [Calothrix sp. NIES-2098]